jgi:hypothetical protein
MRKKNTILAVAITATLSAMNLASAGTFKNVTNDTCYKTIIGDGVTQAATACATLPTLTNTSQGSGLPTSFVPTASADSPVIYGTHLFGSGGSALILPKTDKAIAKYTVEGEIGFDFEFKVSLSNGAQFNNDPTLTLDSAQGGITGLTVPKEGTGNCNGKTYCTWSIGLNSGKLLNSEAFYVAYQMKNAHALATIGETIDLTARLGSAFTVIDEQTVSVAASANPLDVKLAGATDGQIRVSVTSGNTEFNSKGVAEDLLNQSSVIIGSLTIMNQPYVFGDTGLNEWALGDTTQGVFKAGTATGGHNTKLTITNGQFAASVTPPEGETSTGKVYLRDSAGSEVAAAQTVTATEATFELTDGQLALITASDSGNGKVDIVLQADGETAVNIEENPPEATFILDYQATTSLQDETYPVAELRKIRQDGTSCWVYNVPPATAIDILNLRITNESSISGTVMGTLYNMSGGDPVFTNVNLFGAGGDIPPGATKRVTQANIANDLEGGPYSWTGRGSLYMTSTLPELEIMVLLRATTPGAPLTNLSTGASGAACQN